MVSLTAAAMSGLPVGSSPSPTVTVADSVFSSMLNVCSWTRLTRFSAQVSTSRAVPRSSRIRKPLPPNRPQMSVGVSCTRSSWASCAMNSSLASTPIEYWMSLNRSGLTYANWRTPPFMCSAQRSRTASIR